MSSSTHFGIKKDGTIRDKKKILSSSVTLASGEELPLGFTFVAHETGEQIAATIQDQLKEINDTSEELFSSMLHKLSYLMSDRAKNEAKADELLRVWRDKMLAASGEENASMVHSLHCMAHALLGFLYHAKANFTKQAAEYKMDEVKLGREKSQTWRQDFAPLRCVRTACDLAGPLGDEKCGIRDKWLAHLRAQEKEEGKSKKMSAAVVQRQPFQRCF